jgi:hypothetical protein
MDIWCVIRFVAFPATEYDEVLLGYQPGQMVELWENQHFEDHLLEMVFSPLNHLTWLIARENFIMVCYCFLTIDSKTDMEQM